MKLAVSSMLALLGLFACAQSPPKKAGAPYRETPAVAAANTAPSRVPARSRAPVDAPSIYDLTVPLVDESGKERSLDTFRGHPVLITMFYGTCATACPLLTSDLKRIERLIPEPARSRTRVVMVSFDRARDTPAVLSRLKRLHGMDAERWLLASAPDDEARDLAGVLDIRYRKLDSGEFFHSSVIVLLDEQGRPEARLDGLGLEPEPIVSALLPLPT
jgi:protein SCO1/2